MTENENDNFKETEVLGEDVKVRTHDKLLIITGWILFTISLLFTISSMTMPYAARDSSIEALLNHPDIDSFLTAFTYIFVCNILILPPMLLGFFAVSIKNPKGKSLLVASIILFIVSTVAQFLLPPTVNVFS